MHHPTDRITHTIAFVTPVVEHWLECEIAQWVHYEGSIRRSIAPWANTLITELHLARHDPGRNIYIHTRLLKTHKTFQFILCLITWMNYLKGFGLWDFEVLNIFQTYVKKQKTHKHTTTPSSKEILIYIIPHLFWHPYPLKYQYQTPNKLVWVTLDS